MCGIAGKFVRSGRQHGLAPAVTGGVLEGIAHRGPDMAGEFDDGTAWLGHRRLSIIDLSDAAKQPMASADGRYVICYNGEVYNFADLARDLDLQGRRSHSDTDVVLGAFAQRNVASLPLLNGMFAFALYDTVAKKAWLVRDRLGVKPLHFRVDADGLAFGSEVKSVLALSGAAHRCNLSVLREWAYYGGALGEQTFYDGVFKLLPGHYLELDLRAWQWTTRAYWSPTTVPQRANVPDRAILVDETRRLLEQAVQRQLVSDVPVGILLSGGIDSSAITAFAARSGAGRIATYAAGFDFAGGPNELAKARSVAAHYGTDHHEVFVGGVDVADVVERMVHHHDMPFADAANIPLFLMTQQIRGAATVVLQGDGGDELFGGYRRYSTLSHFGFWKAAATVGNLLNGLTPKGPGYYRRDRYCRALLAAEPALVMARLLTAEGSGPEMTRVFSPALRPIVERQDPFARYRACQALVAGRPLVDQMLAIDAMIVLPDIYFEKVDRSTMASSVEARVPFIDNDLVDFCIGLPASVRMPGGRRKWLLKQALTGIVPDAILNQKKLGFGVPFGHWLSGALRAFFLEHQDQFRRTHPDVLDHAYIDALYARHLAGQQDQGFLLWKVLNLMIWANRGTVTF